MKHLQNLESGWDRQLASGEDFFYKNAVKNRADL